MSKRIAIVANSTWNIFNFRLNFIQKLLEEKWKVIVVAPLDEYITYKEKFPEVHHIPLHNLNRDGNSPLKDLKLIFELRTIYKKLKPDLVVHYTHKPNIFGGIAARLSGRESVAVVTGLGYPFLHSGLTQTVTKNLYKLTSAWHSKVIFENADDRQLFEEERLIDKKQGAVVDGCGVDTQHYLPHPNGQVKDKTIFTFMGRLLYDKGIVEFVNAARLVKQRQPDTEFWVVGELDEDNPSMVNKKDLLEWIEQGDIIYHGFLKDVKPVIAKSDCIVLPSYREGLPRIILEGMAMGKPIITTDTAGCRQTIEEGQNGYLVQVGDAEGLSKAMETFLALPYPHRCEMGKKGRALAEDRFNAKKIAKDLFDIVDQV